MKKDINIDFGAIKNSPYLIVAVLCIFVVGILALCVYITMDIFEVKEQILDVKSEYADNCQQVAYLRGLQSKGDQYEAELKTYKDMLPPTEDQFATVEGVYNMCDAFNLDVASVSTPVVTQTYTTETSVDLSVTGTYENIIGFLEYYANLNEIHRVEKLVLKNDESAGLKSADITIVILSEVAA